MPYIPPNETRNTIDKILSLLPIGGVGVLNYIITRVCLAYIAQQGKGYRSINDVVGVLECAKLEFYRRLAAPYEDTKIIENGDVYDTGQ